MAVIPLYTPPSCPDAWHQVIAPGGYEWWHFDAEDAATDTQLVASFYDGDIFDREYWRRYLVNDGQTEWAARARRSLKFCEMQVHTSLRHTMK